MISGYRANNGLGAVTIDPALMKLAEEQSRTMASRDKLDHDVGKAFSNAPQRRLSTPRSRSKIFRPAIIRSPKRSPAGAIRRRTAPTCSTAA